MLLNLDTETGLAESSGHKEVNLGKEVFNSPNICKGLYQKDGEGRKQDSSKKNGNVLPHALKWGDTGLSRGIDLWI